MNDYFGKSSNELKNKKLWLFDIDGTVCKEEQLFNGTIELLDWIVQNNGHYVFITNNSSKSVDDYIYKVNRLGIKASEENFFTSAQATILWLKQNANNAKIYCQGTDSFVKELRENRLDITVNVEPVDVALVGFDTELTMDKLRKTCEVLTLQDVTYIATNPDFVCPVKYGFIPDCGAICEMIRRATKKWPIFMGKPKSIMVNNVAEKFGYDLDDLCVVGDRLYTDIATGKNAGVATICVLTGEADEYEILNSDIKPDYTFYSVMDIYQSLK